MNKIKKLNKKYKTRKNKYGGKNCTQKCKDKYYKLLKKIYKPLKNNKIIQVIKSVYSNKKGTAYHCTK